MGKKNLHHLLFRRKDWASSRYGWLLRVAMVRRIPVTIHNELHNYEIDRIPKPSEFLLENAYNAYLDQKTIVDSLGVCQLILWLCDEIPDDSFRGAMRKQYVFLSERLGRS